VTKKELIEMLRGVSDMKEIVIIAEGTVCDRIDRIFIDSETGNAVLSISKESSDL